MQTKYPHLLTPITIGNLTLKNRIFSAPTSLAELGAGEKFTRENIEYYKLRAAGGAAVVCVGEVIVDLANGRSHPQQIGIDLPQNATVFCQLTDAIHSHGAAASAELDHGGALCAPEFLGKTPAGPSGYVDDWGNEIRAMTEEEILHAAECFGIAAGNAKANAKKYGFDMVMLHGGHGWLIHQFISDITNHRTDKWGGSLENRLRFPLLVIEEVRKAVGPKFPIDIRISGSERCPGGYGIETGVEIAKAIDGKVDMIHVSAGTMMDVYSAVLMHPGIFQKPGVTVKLHTTVDEALIQELAPDASAMHRKNLLRQIQDQENIMVHLASRCTVITEDTVTAEGTDGNAIAIPTDWVVLCAGLRAKTELVEQLRVLVPETYVIGDCAGAKNVVAATREGYDAAVALGQ